jgi:bifunctional DNA-binding transcriptional regulator/antitoxin component of YhaV-PrlF toxin-antitoxin module
MRLKMSEYTRKINRGFQLTLPQTFRDAYHLQIGDYLRIHEENGKLIVEPVNIIPKNPAAALEALFDAATSNFKDLSEDEIMLLVGKELKKSRKNAHDKAKKGQNK